MLSLNFVRKVILIKYRINKIIKRESFNFAFPFFILSELYAIQIYFDGH